MFLRAPLLEGSMNYCLNQRKVIIIQALIKFSDDVIFIQVRQWMNRFLIGWHRGVVKVLYDEQETSQNYSIFDEILNSFNGANRSIYF